MQVTIEIEPKTFSMLQKMKDKGVSLDDVLRDALDQIENKEDLQKGRSVEERIERFNRWAKAPRDLPPLPDEALRRENIYDDRI